MKVVYKLVKRKRKKQIVAITQKEIQGLENSSKKKNIKLKDAIDIKVLTITGSVLVERRINGDFEKKLKKLIEFLKKVFDIDDDPGSAYMICLNEIEKFRREIINKYNNNMTEKQRKLIEKKLALLEEEMKMKSYALTDLLTHEEKKVR